MPLNWLRLQAKISSWTQPKPVRHWLLRAGGQSACVTVSGFLWTWATYFTCTAAGLSHTHTHTLTPHFRAGSGGLVLFNREGWALCRLRKVKKWGRAPAHALRRVIHVVAIDFSLSTDFTSRAAHHTGPRASQMRPFLLANTMVANVSNSPTSVLHNSTIFKMLLYLLETIFFLIASKLFWWLGFFLLFLFFSFF